MDNNMDKNRIHIGCGIIIIIYCLLKPIYLFDSGSMQLCDFFLVLAFLYLIALNKGKLPIPAERREILSIFLIFVAYQLIINGIWYFVYKDTRLILSILFFFFNFLAFYIVLMIETLVGKDIVIKSLLFGCFASVIVASIGAFLGIGVHERNTGLFNNPNQLGYYAILIISIVAYFSKYTSKIWKIIMIGGSVWLILASGSKAAFLGLLIMAVIYVIFGDTNRDTKHLIRTLIVLFAILFLFYMFFYSENSFITSNHTLMYMRNRINRMSTESDSNLGTGRGYDRIFEMGANFLWGMGEGAYKRFITLSGKEAHSTYASLIVSYGLIGFSMMFMFFSKIVKKHGSTIRNLSCLSGLLLYFVSHNGIRNTLFWMFLAVIYIANDTSTESYDQLEE